MGLGEGSKQMKTEYKSYGLLFYSYNPKIDVTIRVSARTKPQDFQVFGFKLDDWDDGEYKKLSKAKFDKAFNETLNKIKEITK